MKRRRALSKQERLETIMLAIAGIMQTERIEGVTIAQIARALDMTPSTHLRKLVNQLAEADCLARVEEGISLGCVSKVVLYSVRDVALLAPTLPGIPRQIVLNLKGKREVVQI